MHRLGLTLLLAASATLALAQYPLEILPLRHRTVEQVLPVLRPLLEPGGTLSGHSNQLFVRASPGNVAELRRVLESVDRPARRLQVLVRFDNLEDQARREIGASGTITNRGSRVEVRAEDSRGRGEERVDQRLMVMDGGRGVISTGSSAPLRTREVIQTPGGTMVRESVTMRERATGFEVAPRVSGQTVHVDISPQRESGDSFQRASTTVSARLGEWFEVGGAAEAAAGDSRGILSSGQSAASASRRIWLKVEELPN
jgi:type II secretory pathway component GspD/PulD (secretin)